MSEASSFVKIDESVLERLRNVSTATLHTALFKRGLRNTFIQGVSRVNQKKLRWLVRPLRCATFRHAKILIQ